MHFCCVCFRLCVGSKNLNTPIWSSMTDDTITPGGIGSGISGLNLWQGLGTWVPKLPMLQILHKYPTWVTFAPCHSSLTLIPKWPCMARGITGKIFWGGKVIFPDFFFPAWNAFFPVENFHIGRPKTNFSGFEKLKAKGSSLHSVTFPPSIFHFLPSLLQFSLLFLIIIMEGILRLLIRRKIFKRTQSAQTIKTNKLHLWIQKSLTKKMSFKLLFELRKRMYVTEVVWKRIPNCGSSKMKGAFTVFLLNFHPFPLFSLPLFSR